MPPPWGLKIQYLKSDFPIVIVAHFSLPIVHSSLPLLIAHYLLPVVYCPLLIAYCPLSTANLSIKVLSPIQTSQSQERILPFTIHHSPFTHSPIHPFTYSPIEHLPNKKTPCKCKGPFLIKRLY
jgi:hypothetical protein